MAGNGRVIRPDSMSVETTFADGPLAQPAVITMPHPAGVKILTIGGLSKTEALAGQIAAGLCKSEGIDMNRLAISAVNIAEAILAECRSRVQQGQPAKSKIEGGDA